MDRRRRFGTSAQRLYSRWIETELDDLDDSYAESVQLAYAAQTAFAHAKGKSKGKGKPGGKSGGKVVRSNLTIADREAKLAELKAKSRCLRCGIVGHWAGDAACKFTGKGSTPKGAATPAPTGGNGTSAAKAATTKPQGFLATLAEDSVTKKWSTSRMRQWVGWKPIRRIFRVPLQSLTRLGKAAEEFSPRRSGAQPQRASCATVPPKDPIGFLPLDSIGHMSACYTPTQGMFVRRSVHLEVLLISSHERLIISMSGMNAYFGHQAGYSLEPHATSQVLPA